MAEAAAVRPPGRFGVWSGAFRNSDTGLVRDAAAELDELGYGILWFPGGTSRTFEVAATLLEAAPGAMVATGIANIWVNEPTEAAQRSNELNARVLGQVKAILTRRQREIFARMQGEPFDFSKLRARPSVR